MGLITMQNSLPAGGGGGQVLLTDLTGGMARLALWIRVGHGLGPSMGWVGLGQSFFVIFGGLGWMET